MAETMTAPRISPKSVDKLARIADDMEAERQPFLSFFARYASKLNPTLQDWLGDTKPGVREPAPKKDVYDTTAMEASDLFANGLQSTAYGRGVPWLQLNLEDSRKEPDKAGQEWLQDTALRMAREMSRSTFYDEGRAFTRSCADFGTGIMFREHDPASGRPYYRVQHIRRSLIAEDRFGQADTLFRDFWLTSHKAKDEFGEDFLPKCVKEDLESNKANPRLYRQYIMPKDKFDLDADLRTKGKPYYSLYICLDARDEPIREGGYGSRPFYAWRWARSMDGDVYGVDSPGMIAYSDMLQANSEKADFSRLVQLAARPPIKETAGIEGGVRIEPGAHHMLRPGQDFTIQPVVGDLKGILEDINRLQANIRGKYYTNFFLTLQMNMERIKTATEVAGIKGEQSAQLAAMSGRLFAEFLEPASEDLFSLMYQYGQLAPVPQSLKGMKLKIDLVSPLAQLQKRYMMLNETDEFMGRILQIAERFPQAGDVLDIDAYVTVLSESYNQDKRVIRDLIDVQRIRKQRAAQQETMAVQQMQNERAKAQAAVLQAGGRAPEQGSPVQAMMGGQAQGAGA